jgi:hypothetical protein
LQRKRIALDLSWKPRESKQAADDLTNCRFQDFSTELRILVELKELPWVILLKIIDEATQLEVDMALRRAQRSTAVSCPGLTTGTERKSDSMKVRDPW